MARRQVISTCYHFTYYHFTCCHFTCYLVIVSLVIIGIQHLDPGVSAGRAGTQHAAIRMPGQVGHLVLVADNSSTNASETAKRIRKLVADAGGDAAVEMLLAQLLDDLIFQWPALEEISSKIIGIFDS